MPIVNKTAPMLENIHTNLMEKILNPKACAKNERVIKVWQFDGRKPHAGQIWSEKVMPNGNIQRRITTAYAGNGATISTDTRVYSPSGDLLRAYHGLRGNSYLIKDKDGKLLEDVAETRAYASNSAKDLHKVISEELDLNPSLKYFPHFPQ